MHYTPNETIHGVEFHDIPDVGGVPLVADFSSNILSRPLDVSRFGVLYGGAQKNLGPAGLAIAIVRKDLLGQHGRELPPIFDLANQANNDSMFNTPPTFAWYMLGLVLKWLKAEGGAAAIGERNAAQGGAAVCGHRRLRRLLSQPGRPGGAFADERAFRPARRRARQALPARKPRRRACWGSRAIARSAACALRSTTPCR